MELNEIVTSDEIARIIGISKRQVQRLTKEGILPCKRQNPYKYVVPETVQAYILNIQKSKADESTDSVELEKRKLLAEVRIKENKAHLSDMERAEFEGRMHDSEDVEELVSDLVLAIRSGVISIPGRIAYDVSVESDPAVCAGIARNACNDVLRELANHKYDPEKYRQRVKERKGLMQNELADYTETEETEWK